MILICFSLSFKSFTPRREICHYLCIFNLDYAPLSHTIAHLSENHFALEVISVTDLPSNGEGFPNVQFYFLCYSLSGVQDYIFLIICRFVNLFFDSNTSVKCIIDVVNVIFQFSLNLISFFSFSLIKGYL